MDQSMEAIIQAVTTQVLAALEQENKLPDRRSEGKTRCLVLGDSDHIPQALRRDAVLLGLEAVSYTHLEHDAVFVGHQHMVADDQAGGL